jgi:hypothetical protein
MPNMYGSGEYPPTPSHSLPAFVGGKPQGFVCTTCGHIQKDLDPIFEDLCLVCLKNWAIKQGVSRLLSMEKAIEKEKALEPTVKVQKKRCEQTTVIISNKPKTVRKID